MSNLAKYLAMEQASDILKRISIPLMALPYLTTYLPELVALIHYDKYAGVASFFGLQALAYFARFSAETYKGWEDL